MIQSLSLYPPKPIVKQPEPVKNLILKVQELLLKLQTNCFLEAIVITHVEMIVIKKEVAKSEENPFLPVMEKIVSLLEKPPEDLPFHLVPFTENLPAFRKNMLAEKHLSSILKEKENYLKVLEERKKNPVYYFKSLVGVEDRLDRSMGIIEKKIESLKLENQAVQEAQQKLLFELGK